MSFSTFNTKFPMKKIGEGAEVFSGYSFKSKDFSETGIPVVKIKNVNNKLVNLEDVQYFPNEKITDKTSKYYLENKDVLIAMTGQGSVGRVGRLFLKGNQNALLNQRVGKFVTDNKVLDLDYLYYILSSKRYEQILFDAGTGSGQPNLSPKIIKSILIPFPDIKTQRGIAQILNQLDEKIQLNNDIIFNLEDMVQAFFKRWFIDLDFPDENSEPYKTSGGSLVPTEHGVVPKGWETKQLGDIIYNIKSPIKVSKATLEKPYVPIDVLPMEKLTFYKSKSGKEAKSSLISFNKNDILIGAMRVYFHRVCIAPFDGTTRTTCFVLRPKEEEYLFFSLLLLFQKEAINFAESTSKGTTMPYAVWENGLAKYSIIYPPKHIIKSFNNIVSPLFNLITELHISNEKLSEVRNVLIQKLFSGELKIPAEREEVDHVHV